MYDGIDVSVKATSHQPSPKPKKKRKKKKKKAVYWKHETGLMLSWGRGKCVVICNLASTYVTMVSRKKILAIKFVAKVACLARRYFKYLVILDAW